MTSIALKIFITVPYTSKWHVTGVPEANLICKEEKPSHFVSQRCFVYSLGVAACKQYTCIGRAGFSLAIYTKRSFTLFTLLEVMCDNPPFHTSSNFYFIMLFTPGFHIHIVNEYVHYHVNRISGWICNCLAICVQLWHCQ